MTFRFYIATGLENHEMHNSVRDWLQRLGYIISYDWTPHGPAIRFGMGRVREVAIAEVEGVAAADFVVVLLPGGRGTHVELGVALSLNIPVFFLTEKSFDEMGAESKICAFYMHPMVREFRHLDELVAKIVEMFPREAAPVPVKPLPPRTELTDRRVAMIVDRPYWTEPARPRSHDCALCGVGDGAHLLACPRAPRGAA